MIFVSAVLIYIPYTTDLLYTSKDFVPTIYPYIILLAVTTVTSWFYFFKEDIPLNLKTKPNTSYIFYYLFCVCAIASIYILSTAPGIEFQRVLVLFFSTIFIGINEEGLFRLILMGGLLSLKYSGKKSIFISSLAFSALHLFNIIGGVGPEIIFQLLNTFLIGNIMGYIYLISGRIIYPVLLHFIWDFVALLNSTYSVDHSKEVILVVTFLSSIFCAVIVLFKLFKRRELLKN